MPNLQRIFDKTDSEWVKQRLHAVHERAAVRRVLRQAAAGRGDGRPAARATTATPDRPSARPAWSASRARWTTSRCPSRSWPRRGGRRRLPRCPSKSAAAVVLPGYSIDDVTRMTVGKAKVFFESLKLNSEGAKVAEPIVREINSRLGFMVDVGLEYLTLDRKTGSLQRRGGPADPAGHASGQRAGRRLLRAGRADDRVAPAGQHPAAADAPATAGDRQHGHHRRARRGLHSRRRPPDRHRPRGRHATAATSWRPARCPTCSGRPARPRSST